MSATQPESSERDLDAGDRTARAPEPSMEEILASIRAIIADERQSSAANSSALAAAPPAGKTATGPQIIYSKFGQGKPVQEPPARSTEPASAAPSAYFAAAAAAAASPVRAAEPAPAAARPATSLLRTLPPVPRDAPEPPLASKATDLAVSASLQSLAAAAAAPDPKRLDDMAREMLRPMLKAWLDDNLPGLVERLVRAEIQRIARGGK